VKTITTYARMGALAALAAAVPACDDRGFNNNQSFNIAWFIDPAFGDDFMNDGSPQFPLRTISRALQFSISGDEIVLAAGTYSAASGEVFPILVKPGVLILGDPASSGTTTAILGEGPYTVQGGTQVISNPIKSSLVLGNGVQITGVKVTSATGFGMVCDGTSPLITSSTITACGVSGIGTFQGAAPTITSTTITANGGTGVTTFDTSSPALRSCTITLNTSDGVLAEDTSTPNLGDSATAGFNTLTGNTGVGLNNNTTSSTIQAVGNTWIASVQGADGSGHYGPMLTLVPVAAVGGNNYAVTQALASIQF